MQRVNINRGSKHKPTRGQKRFMAQNAKAQTKAVNIAAANSGMTKKITAAVRARWAKMAHWFWKNKFLTGKYTPHQGHQEKARRVRQMTEHKCINPEAWK